MMSISSAVVGRAVVEYGLSPLPVCACEGLSSYIALLMRWNKRLNLTSIRDEEQVLRRHILEGVLVAQNIPAKVQTVLDFGSGAGVPGIPVAICRPDLDVTLAESSQKKAAFLREVGRAMGCAYRVHAARVEEMAANSRFDAITMRAVDRMRSMMKVAIGRLDASGSLMILTTSGLETGLREQFGAALDFQRVIQAQSSERVLLIGTKSD